MEIIENPTRTMLEEIQSVLDKEHNVGIVDIWSAFDANYFVVLVQNIPIAVATLNDDNECYELYKLYVIPSYRKKGVAMTLFEHIVQKLIQNGTKEVFVEMTNESFPFWCEVAKKYPFEQIEATLKLFFKLNPKMKS